MTKCSLEQKVYQPGPPTNSFYWHRQTNELGHSATGIGCGIHILRSLHSFNMNVAVSVPSTVSSISFSFLSTEDIRRISVKQILNPVLLDDLNRPNVGGLYDSALGPCDRQDM